MGAPLGCAGPPVAMDEGPPRPVERVAVLDVVEKGQMKVVAIDEVATDAWTFHLEPGAHRVRVEIRVAMQGGFAHWTIQSQCVVPASFEAGEAFHSPRCGT